MVGCIFTGVGRRVLTWVVLGLADDSLAWFANGLLPWLAGGLLTWLAGWLLARLGW